MFRSLVGTAEVQRPFPAQLPVGSAQVCLAARVVSVLALPEFMALAQRCQSSVLGSPYSLTGRLRSSIVSCSGFLSC